MRNPKADDNSPRNIISARLRQARIAFIPSLTQDQLAGRLAARHISLDRVAITKIENGQRCVFDFEVKILADVLGVDVRWLLGIQPTGGPKITKRSTDEV
jgi:DNA-binding XRE family transcriptional regulator